MAGHPLDRPYEGGFLGGVHHFAVRVYFEDTDVGGVVYHANYLRFMERARSDMLACVGIDQRAAHEAGEGVYAVTHVDLRFVRPARLGDALVIESRVLRSRGASCAIHQRVRRDGEEIAVADVTVAFLSPDGRPRRQPKPWVGIFDDLARASNHQEESSPA
ncbi:YbgC/FadM family acyl-CoA thioesterase [Sphingomonas quercus]|uniref:YbgC/FadM family acyl-CoA thioesterase n=1 Tax=Sphingomonas quercus TaxID=2842451 RepID=A0ABS6BHC8_9SPHN|nr:YbgC/FadM family acyl-CoA thioesterase [Sphingomonas quercus]MBU3076866.1 YbgC/FadM family acyl-CoA thioesterase [Sphingomonas quercus]